ncbi:MAG TPA: LysM peptidoglycan-binding domain-containing protein [Thermoanaerobaculia bacterium]|nr:LysM peptidoglycan-binding domain-containing protein [Thermoanaerobaculia bacterium]
MLLFLMALPLAAQQTSSRPPTNLHMVGDHWTAYNPPDPSTYPPNARTHTIVRGDTLWDLAQQYYGNAYLWPQLWESNTWITDAHWIYPGDVLLIEGEGAGATLVTDTTVSTRPGTGDAAAQSGQQMQMGIVATEARREVTPIPLGTEADVYCYGYIGHPQEPMPNHIEGFEDVEVLYQPGLLSAQEAGVTAGDLVFVAGGTSTGLVAGETYMIIEPADMIYHPRTKELVGRHYNFQGQLRILCAEPTQSRAIITQSCREIKIGTRLKPVPQLPIPIARIPEIPGFCDVPTGRQAGFIIDSLDWDLALAEGNLVQVDLGRDDQLQPGDFLVVYRDSPIAGQPRQVLGEIGILTTESRTATGKIVAMRRTMLIGDYVERR